MKRYDDSIYAAFRRFGNERVHRIFGNHDLEWGGLRDPTRTGVTSPAPATEGIKLGDDSGKIKILLVHGHQGSLESDLYAWLSRAPVRLFGYIEPLAKLIGLYGAGAAPKSPIAKEFERVMYSWAKRNKVILICGHSHNAIFASKAHWEKLADEKAQMEAENMARETDKETRQKNLRRIQQLEMELLDEKEQGRLVDPLDPGNIPLPCYFNTGCGLYSTGPTCIEIEDDAIRSIKWTNDASAPVGADPREVRHEAKLSELMDQITQAADGN